LFTLCNLVIVFLILKKFLFKPVNKMIDDRQKEIDDLYADAAQSKQEAESMKSEYDRRLSEAKNTSAELVAEATREANRRSDEIILAARKDADALRARAEADLEQERRKALNEAKDDISRIALDIAEKVVEKNLDASDQDRMFEDFLQDMGDLV